MHKILKDAASLALSNVDKRSVVELAAKVAGAVARGDGHRGLRIVAGLLSDGLATYTGQSPQNGQQRTRGEGSPPAKPNRTSTDGWQRAKKLLEERSQGTGTAVAGPTAEVSTAPAPTPAVPGRVVSRGTLSRPFDAANIGSFAFSFFNGSQLQVNQLRAAGNLGGQFWLGDLPAGTWHRLKDRGGRLLPIWIRVNDIYLDVQVEGGPDGAPLLQATDMLHQSTLG